MKQNNYLVITTDRKERRKRTVEGTKGGRKGGRFDQKDRSRWLEKKRINGENTRSRKNFTIVLF